MISILVLATAAILGVGIVATFWKDILSWVKRAAQKVKEMIRMAVLGCKVFIKKMGEVIQEISRHYAQDSQQKWHETTVTREIPEHEVPEEIRAKARKQAGQAVDVTKELELQLA